MSWSSVADGDQRVHRHATDLLAVMQSDESGARNWFRSSLHPTPAIDSCPWMSLRIADLVAWATGLCAKVG
jgi:hypothetical protein